MNKPSIALICAMANNRVIGKNNQMPWHLPADLKHFKAITMAKPIIMGRKTFQSIGRPLPGRKNIIISQNENFQAQGGKVVHSIEQALKQTSHADEIMIIGGGFLYSQMIERADKLYLTLIDADIEGDTSFPEYQHLHLVETNAASYKKDEDNPYDYQFVEYQITP